MQAVSSGDNLHEMFKPIFWKKKIKEYFKIWSAVFFTQSAKLYEVITIFTLNVQTCISKQTA